MTSYSNSPRNCHNSVTERTIVLVTTTPLISALPASYFTYSHSHLCLRVAHCIAATQRRIRGMLMSGKQLSLDSRMDLVQRLVTDRENGSQISESAENESDIEENPEGMDQLIPAIYLNYLNSFAFI